ncbi:transcriptional regulator with XRE-family HTH domain [Variovorax boronicumulans]|uniref:Transcriptional regulator with XRE-family HTH domain n=1 Tax=Variovorax boronicumulans TaxID=436515 RepID=A0AAW8DU60_9BURK|nr:helix-turn-helix domain-containing protein [Variovorax boronicumulans]MDP9877599.1 transcriptional regulator with XRE-family HTH domain [Variovorax boronicumulans]MDP9922884.1 transcriptional regulator with XRE-family HTH domain [Variovorax boronicumulans]
MARHLPQESLSGNPQIRTLEDLGLTVRSARARGRLRIDDAAAFIGVSADMLSRLENGKPVTTDRLLKVLEGLGLEMLVVPKSQALRFRDAALRDSE